MKLICSSFLLFAFLPFSVGCSRSTDTPATVKPAAAPVFDEAEIQQDIKTGKLKFEIRGLTNETQEKSYGKGFQHSAIVVPVGDSKYLKGNFLLFCSVKRLSGVDPENSRKGDDLTSVYIHNGMGRLAESGGFKGRDEKWEPERIEIRPEMVFIGTPIEGTAVQE